MNSIEMFVTKRECIYKKIKFRKYSKGNYDNRKKCKIEKRMIKKKENKLKEKEKNQTMYLQRKNSKTKWKSTEKLNS